MSQFMPDTKGGGKRGCRQRAIRKKEWAGEAAGADKQEGGGNGSGCSMKL